MDRHLDASLPEPAELIRHAGEAGVVGVGRDRHFEPRAATRPARRLGNRLHCIRREPADVQEFAPEGAFGSNDSRGDDRGLFRASRLCLPTFAYQEVGGVDEVAIGAHPFEHAVRHDNPELRLERERHVEQAERIGREIVGERYLRGKLFDAHTEIVGDQASQTRLRDLGHTPATPPARRNRAVPGHPDLSP